jgi:hypothetical protein
MKKKGRMDLDSAQFYKQCLWTYYIQYNMDMLTDIHQNTKNNICTYNVYNLLTSRKEKIKTFQG